MIVSTVGLRHRDFTAFFFFAALLLIAAAVAEAQTVPRTPVPHTRSVPIPGILWAWGSNADGQLGNGSTNDSHAPVQIVGLSGVISIAGVSLSSLAVRDDGTVWAWGDNGSGQLGNNTTTNSSVPVQVKDPTGTTFLSGVTAVAASAAGSHSLALKSDGTVWAWGFNPDGQLGNNTTADSSLPVQVKDPTGASFLTGVAAIAAGEVHSLALKSDGTVWTWGSGSLLPVQVKDSTGASFLASVTAIAAGDFHSMALMSNGTVWTWGDNQYGQLGNNSATYSSLPVQVKDPTGVSYLTGMSAVAGGSGFSLAVRNDGTVWAWGSNPYGELGNNSTTGTTLPVQVKDPTGTSYLTGVTAIAAGYEQSLALKGDGTVWGWGENLSGQLGDSSTGNSSLPVQISNLSGALAVAGGYSHSLAIAANPIPNVLVTSSQEPAAVGQAVTFTTTVSAVAPMVGIPTGTVTFYDGATSLGTKSLSSGQATLVTSTLTFGSHDISAYYSGDNVFSVATSRGLIQQVLYAASAALSSSANPSANGQLITFTATVQSVGRQIQVLTPSGTVTFLDGTTPLATKTLLKGAAVFSTSALVVGNHSLSASYSGDTNFTPTRSAALTQIVLNGVSLAMSSSSNPSVSGQSITFTATVSPVAPATGVPTGTISFLDGTTVLGHQALSNGHAAFSTSGLAIGSQDITASYSGNSSFAATSSSALIQVVENAWLPADISVGADDLSRVLWTYPNGQAVLWSLERTTGNYTHGPGFGPYDGGAWHAARISCGMDGISHVIWNKSDGTLSLWWLNANNSFQRNMIYGPFAGWTATDISIGSDNQARILWTNTDGQALVWSVNSSTGNYTPGPTYGPYAGYTAVALACGSDGLTRLVWANPLGIASYWIMNAQNQQQSFTLFGPYTGWIPTDIDVGSDGLARLLWTNTVDGRAIVWSVDASGNASDNQNFYGPFTGYTAQRVACGTDGFTRLTWVSTGGILSFWQMAADNTMLTFNIYGPYVSP